jgi:hypothetical protein
MASISAAVILCSVALLLLGAGFVAHRQQGRQKTESHRNRCGTPHNRLPPSSVLLQAYQYTGVDRYAQKVLKQVFTIHWYRQLAADDGEPERTSAHSRNRWR